MKSNNILLVPAILLIILGIVMIYSGAFNGPQFILPPVITGIGFFIIAWAFIKLRK